MLTEPSFSLCIEEEYLLVHRDSGELADAPPEFMEACQDALGSQISPELLKCQVEVGTSVCASIPDARKDLRRLRSIVAEIAARFDLAPIAAACHPSADWKVQNHTDKARYNALWHDLAGVGRRMLICGMHVHVGIEDDDLRIDLMNQIKYFLPHLLALSCSSPFFNGDDTGLASYRLTVFDNLPRTGLPPRFESYSEFRANVAAIVQSGSIEDATKIWWDLRPSDRFPTLETRICDVVPRLDHAISIAALTQCLMRMLYRLRALNQRWRIYDNFLIAENRWRAQRHGPDQGLIDYGRNSVVDFADLLSEIRDLVVQDAEALGCRAELDGALNILREGTSATRQRRTYQAAMADHGDQTRALGAVTKSLIEEFTADL